MWIIFDLDDTLIDTSGSITPFALRQALEAIEESEAPFGDFESAYRELLDLNATSVSSRQALALFGARRTLPAPSIDAALKWLSDPQCWHSIAPVKGASALLHRLTARHHLALVTRGEERVQRQKMELAGIDVQLFKKCYFCPDSAKKKSYELFALETGAVAENVWVCGDRIAFDLSPAKALGYHTVQLKWGRGLRETGLKSDVDYTIYHLDELETLLPSQPLTSRE